MTASIIATAALFTLGVIVYAVTTEIISAKLRRRQ
jgi:hypothetical protein